MRALTKAVPVGIRERVRDLIERQEVELRVYKLTFLNVAACYHGKRPETET